jgi:uncharacterized protein with von Willebrand factor type A (vWA) domain
MQRNTWLKMNTNKLVAIKQRLIECEYLPEYRDFPLREIQALLKGAEAEILKLNAENGKLKEEVETYNQEIKRLDDLLTKKNM